MFLLIALGLPAWAEEEPPKDKLVGVGYKLGNVIRFMGGDVIVNPLPHLSLDLYGAYIFVATDEGDKATGFALAPAVQWHLFWGTPIQAAIARDLFRCCPTCRRENRPYESPRKCRRQLDDYYAAEWWAG